jgi:hypothetical protein
MSNLNNSKRDQRFTAIFTQLDLLRELAILVGDEILKDDLERTLEGTVSRYCEEKRVGLAVTLNSEAGAAPKYA